jgi:lambda repressor-like predicted transcriptional regulator
MSPEVIVKHWLTSQYQTQRAMAADLHVSRDRIWRALNAAGISTPCSPVTVDRAAIVARFQSGFTSIRGLAREFGVSRPAVEDALAANGVAVAPKEMELSPVRVAAIARLAKVGSSVRAIAEEVHASRATVRRYWPDGVPFPKPQVADPLAKKSNKRHVTAPAVAAARARAASALAGSYHDMNVIPDDERYGPRWRCMPRRPLYEPPTRTSPGPWQL